MQALLSAPEPTDPQDAEVAKMYLTDRKLFDSTARFWTETYANDSSDSAKIEHLTSMGFSADVARKALEQCNGDEIAALEKLLGA